MKFVQTTLVFALSAMSSTFSYRHSKAHLSWEKPTCMPCLRRRRECLDASEAAKCAQQSGDIFPSFYQRTTEAHELIKQGAAARAKGMPDQVTLEASAKAQSNSNPIVAGMGGIDKVQQMTQNSLKQQRPSGRWPLFSRIWSPGEGATRRPCRP